MGGGLRFVSENDGADVSYDRRFLQEEEATSERRRFSHVYEICRSPLLESSSLLTCPSFPSRQKQAIRMLGLDFMIYCAQACQGCCAP